MKSRDSMFLYIITSKVTRVLITFFLMWNIIWCINWYQYQKHTKEYTKTPHTYYSIIDDYTCTVAAPEYLKFTGNYAITSENGIGIIIWPHVFSFGTPVYGIEFSVDENIIYRFYVDENLNYLSNDEMHYDEEDEIEIKMLLNAHKDEIHNMMQIAEKEWGL